MGVYLATGAVLLIWLILAWFIGTWLHPRDAGIWILRGGLALLGLIGGGIFLWFHHKTQSQQSGLGPSQGDGSAEDVDLLVHDAVKRLRQSRLGAGASLGKLPLVFLLGPSGGTKTTTILNSGLDPELLAGHVHQDNQILPTRTANIWYTRQAVFVDVAGGLLAQPGRWARLVKLSQPGRISSAVGSSQQAPRAAIVCYDCENFLRSGASEFTVSSARKLAGNLQEVSQVLGISFPVYVLFTKVDRVPFFAEFVRNLSRDEATQVLGATLPVRGSQSAGVYAEEETRRLTKAFDDLFYSLAEKRCDLLARENEAQKRAAVYEFPRELRKIRTLLVQFLVDLARPSQLRSNPFLRGFYFCGVRPIVVDDVAPAAPESFAEPAFDAGATRIFGGGPQLRSAAVPAPVAASRKVPQWVFVTQLLNDVILKDRVALSTSGFSTRVNLLRRVMLIAAVCVGLILAIAFTISFFGNRALTSAVAQAASEIPRVELRAGQLPAAADLRRLENLRQAVVLLESYEKDGAPWHLRWGLYTGDRLYPAARELYFARFREMLFGQTQDRLLAWLRGLPNSPPPNDSYEKTYNALKAYLITTSNNEKSTVDFLSPALLSAWKAGQDIDPERSALAKQQFDFYSAELASANPYSSDNDSATVARSRSYLSQFGGIDRYYVLLIAAASNKVPPVSFNEQFRDSAGAVLGDYRVQGAFTRDGFKFVQGQIRDISNYIGGEDWVLGKVTASDLNTTTLQQKLSERYYQDYVKEWHTALDKAQVVRFQQKDAEAKLARLTSLTSPLLELFWFVSHNTDVGLPEVAEPFSSVQSVEPPGPADKLPDQYVLPSNNPYVMALAKLQSDFGMLANSPQGLGDPVLSTQALNSAGAAKLSISQVIGTRVDQQFHTEEISRRLLEEPISYVEGLLKQGPKEALNKGGGGLCSQFRAISDKFPFNPASQEDLPVSQLNQIFAPGTGSLWSFYSAQLTQFLTKQGTRYEASSSGSVKLSPAFVEFFNRAAAFSEALYPAGSSTPKVAYTLRQMPSNVEDLSLRIGSETLSGAGQAKTFYWTGIPEDVQVTGKGGDSLEYRNGPWAPFHFVSDARAQAAGSNLNLEWIIESNGRPTILPNGKVKSYNYQLQVSGTSPFRPGEFSGLRCVSQVAR